MFNISLDKASKLYDDFKGAEQKDIIAVVLKEFVRRQNNDGKTISMPSDIVSYVYYLSLYEQEHIVIVYLNGHREILEISELGIGTDSSCVIDLPSLFRKAIKLGASAFIMVHNHPSGSLEPSEEDNDSASRLKDAGEILGISMLDSIIVSKDGFYSFKEHDLIF